MERLKDKVAVVTGASSGIGRSIASAFSVEGADVVVNYQKSKASANAVVQAINQAGRRAILMRADMSDEADINAMIKKTVEQFGRIDIWVNNAGADILTGTNAAITVHEKLEHLIEVDLKGTIKACWSITPTMQQQGHGVIVNMSWDLAVHGFIGTNPQLFATAKAGVLGFTRSFAKTVAPTIRANIVSPGWIETAFAKRHMEPEYYQARINEIPLRRFGRPEDVAAAVVFLASEQSSYLTGEAIKVNGGLV